MPSRKKIWPIFHPPSRWRFLLSMELANTFFLERTYSLKEVDTHITLIKEF
jgi:hypothetical protein